MVILKWTLHDHGNKEGGLYMIMETKDFMGQTMLSIREKARKMPASSMTLWYTILETKVP